MGGFVQPTVRVDISALSRFRALITGATAVGALLGTIGGSPLSVAFGALGGLRLQHRILRAWEAIYKGFIYRRFDRYSKGGGDWAPLAASTLRRRRRGRGTGSPAILRDTGMLFAALNPNVVGDPAKVMELITTGTHWEINVGYGGPQRYPDGASVSDIASFHQTGGPHLPQRKIIVPPDQETLDRMAEAARQEIKWYFMRALLFAGFRTWRKGGAGWRGKPLRRLGDGPPG